MALTLGFVRAFPLTFTALDLVARGAGGVASILTLALRVGVSLGPVLKLGEALKVNLCRGRPRIDNCGHPVKFSKQAGTQGVMGKELLPEGG